MAAGGGVFVEIGAVAGGGAGGELEKLLRFLISIPSAHAEPGGVGDVEGQVEIGRRRQASRTGDQEGAAGAGERQRHALIGVVDRGVGFERAHRLARDVESAHITARHEVGHPGALAVCLFDQNEARENAPDHRVGAVAGDDQELVEITVAGPPRPIDGGLDPGRILAQQSRQRALAEPQSELPRLADLRGQPARIQQVGRRIGIISDVEGPNRPERVRGAAGANARVDELVKLRLFLGDLAITRRPLRAVIGEFVTDQNAGGVIAQCQLDRTGAQFGQDELGNRMHPPLRVERRSGAIAGRGLQQSAAPAFAQFVRVGEDARRRRPRRRRLWRLLAFADGDAGQTTFALGPGFGRGRIARRRPLGVAGKFGPVLDVGGFGIGRACEIDQDCVRGGRRPPARSVGAIEMQRRRAVEALPAAGPRRVRRRLQRDLDQAFVVEGEFGLERQAIGDRRVGDQLELGDVAFEDDAGRRAVRRAVDEVGPADIVRIVQPPTEARAVQGQVLGSGPHVRADGRFQEEARAARRIGHARAPPGRGHPLRRHHRKRIVPVGDAVRLALQQDGVIVADRQVLAENEEPTLFRCARRRVGAEGIAGRDRRRRAALAVKQHGLGELDVARPGLEAAVADVAGALFLAPTTVQPVFSISAQRHAERELRRRLQVERAIGAGAVQGRVDRRRQRLEIEDAPPRQRLQAGRAVREGLVRVIGPLEADFEIGETIADIGLHLDRAIDPDAVVAGDGHARLATVGRDMAFADIVRRLQHRRRHAAADVLAVGRRRLVLDEDLPGAGEVVPDLSGGVLGLGSELCLGRLKSAEVDEALVAIEAFGRPAAGEAGGAGIEDIASEDIPVGNVAVLVEHKRQDELFVRFLAGAVDDDGRQIVRLLQIARLDAERLVVGDLRQGRAVQIDDAQLHLVILERQSQRPAIGRVNAADLAADAAIGDVQAPPLSTERDRLFPRVEIDLELDPFRRRPGPYKLADDVGRQVADIAHVPERPARRDPDAVKMRLVIGEAPSALLGDLDPDRPALAAVGVACRPERVVLVDGRPVRVRVEFGDAGAQAVDLSLVETLRAFAVVDIGFGQALDAAGLDDFAAIGMTPDMHPFPLQPLQAGAQLLQLAGAGGVGGDSRLRRRLAVRRTDRPITAVAVSPDAEDQAVDASAAFGRDIGNRRLVRLDVVDDAAVLDARGGAAMQGYLAELLAKIDGRGEGRGRRVPDEVQGLAVVAGRDGERLSLVAKLAGQFGVERLARRYHGVWIDRAAGRCQGVGDGPLARLAVASGEHGVELGALVGLVRVEAEGRSQFGRVGWRRRRLARPVADARLGQRAPHPAGKRRVRQIGEIARLKLADQGFRQADQMRRRHVGPRRNDEQKRGEGQASGKHPPGPTRSAGAEQPDRTV